MSIFDTSSLGVADNKVTFGDLTVSPVFRVTARYPTKREIREFDIPIPETQGVADYQTFNGKSYYVISGIMYPQSEADFWAGRQALQKVASLAYEQADSSTNSGYVPYSWNQTVEGGMQLWVKPEYVDIPENTKQGLVQPFRIFCKIKSPVILSANPVSATLGPAFGAVNTGSSGLPFGLPIGLGSTTYQYNGTLTNAGTIPTYPTFNLTGPAVNPIFTNTNTGEFFQINTTLNLGDTLNITYSDSGISLTQNGNSVYNLLTTTSTLFTIRPGQTSIAFAAGSTTNSTIATVSFYSAWPLS